MGTDKCSSYPIFAFEFYKNNIHIKHYLEWFSITSVYMFVEQIESIRCIYLAQIDLFFSILFALEEGVCRICLGKLVFLFKNLVGQCISV